jgi:hypothetical protein
MDGSRTLLLVTDEVGICGHKPRTITMPNSDGDIRATITSGTPEEIANTRGNLGQ